MTIPDTIRKLLDLYEEQPIIRTQVRDIVCFLANKLPSSLSARDKVICEKFSSEGYIPAVKECKAIYGFELVDAKRHADTLLDDQGLKPRLSYGS